MSDERERFSNRLSDAEAERLAILAEECGEVIQAVCKILRHGYASRNPEWQESPTNRSLLSRELGDVEAAIGLMIANGDLHSKSVAQAKERKIEALRRWTHYQEHFA